MSTVTISAADVNKLRKQTGAGMMDCKKALVEANGDFEAAVDYLRKKGQKVSASRSDRDAKEGAAKAYINNDATKGIVIELNCETDFVAKNEDFVALTDSFGNAALNSDAKTIEEVLELTVDGKKISDLIIDNIGKIGEKLQISNFEVLNAEQVVGYTHAGNKIGVLLSLNKSTSEEGVALGRDIAMQIAAMRPIAVDRDGIDEATIERERAIAKEQILAEGKPANMVDKIAEGKLNKFFKENTLVNQAFVKDNSKSVKQVLTDLDKDLKVVSFKRVELGA